MATAKMKIILPLVVWTWLHFVTTTTGQSFGGIGFGIKREVFFLNLEDGYFGCQVNESTDVLQLFELSKLCDGTPNCYLGSDELAKELKCTDDCRKEDGTECQNGACLDSQCYCNDGYGGCSCEVPDENECKYRPCDVFAHCTNTLGSFSCTCFPGYHGDGFRCEDIDECSDPAISGRCVENAECCNLPAHFLCKCKSGFQGDGEVQCLDIDECQHPNACGQNAHCQNTPGNYTCLCPEGFYGNPYDGCVDVDECEQLGACGPGATCSNLVGGRQCHCPPGYEGDPYTTGCIDFNECARNPCGRNALCSNLEGSFKCTCPPGFIGDPLTGCSAAECNNDLDCSDQKACINFQCVNPCSLKGACGENALCKTLQHRPRCSCPECYMGSANTGCYPDPKCSQTQPRPAGVAVCFTDSDCDSKLACDLRSGKCYDPCERQGARCTDNKKCEVHYHKATCVCKKGFLVNELGEISCAPEKAECTTDDQCPDNRACIDRVCQNPCTARPEAPCAPDKTCDVLHHKPTCICLKNCSPSLSICLRDSGCTSDQACRAFRCENPCETANCPENTPCRVENHKPVCEYCPPGLKQDPRYGCFKDIQCRSHSECAPQLACVNRKCQNPCLVSNPCTNSQDCRVQEHQPVCVKVCQCQSDHDCAHLGQQCDGCNCNFLARNPPGCSHCPPGVSCNPLTKACHKVGCTTNEECPISEACIDRACQRPCDVHNPCAQHAVCINTNHGCDCSCEEGYQGDGFVGCAPVLDHGPPVCQYNEDCPPNKLCDRLNRRCINPCFEDSCGDNAECIPKNHEATCVCIPGYEGNAYVECVGVLGCRHDDECATTEACIDQQCSSPCNCGTNAICDVIYHKPQCKCPPGYQGDARVVCQPPTNPCDPNPCGINAICELDNGNPICFCPKGLTGNPFKNCIPEGDECSPNPCGPNSGCRVVGGNAVCFCLPEYEGTPPHIPCNLPAHPCEPSPCGPNTQCTVLANGFAKCTCLPGFLESPNTIRGCIEPKNPCEPNPCGTGALCDPHGEPVCYCPYGTGGNPFRSCGIIEKPLCSPGPCGANADCYNSNNEEQCFCRSGFIGDPYAGCRIQPPSPCVPNPCGPGAQCIVTPDGNSLCRCPEGMGGDPTGALGCFGYECVVDENCGDHEACISYRCRDPCPGSCGLHANCRVESHHPVCSCQPGLTGNPIIRCFPVPQYLPPDPCMPNPCGLNTICQVIHGRAVCSCLPDFHGDPQIGCQPECLINSDCPINKACLDRHCVDPCALNHLCGINAQCQVRDHTAACICSDGFMGDPFLQCIHTPTVVIPTYPNVTTHPCTPSPCGNMECSIYGTQIAICDPCLGPEAAYNPQCRPECLTNADCPFQLACLRFSCIDPCPGSCGVNALCSVVAHAPICSCPQGLIGDPFQQCVVPVVVDVTPKDTCDYQRCGVNADCLESDHGIVCVCRKGFFGNPYLACHPECVVNPDCALDKACINSKCSNPCTDVCGVGAHCDVVNHIPICFCPPQHTGDPFVACYKVVIPSQPHLPPVNPCDPSPCGPFSRCLVSHQGYATCSCLPNYQGIAPACKPECISTSECPQTRACINQKCSDPCPGTCGSGALCIVINHNPICSCPPEQQGNPFVGCHPRPVIVEDKSNPTTEEPVNPCVPSPCGPNSICQVKENRPVCSCVANYIGSPPLCRPECVISQECPQHQACENEKCIDPCVGACGPNAHCQVVNHTPFCSCVSSYEGDAFVGCTKVVVVPKDPCNPSPCGENAQCSVSGNAAKCTCIPPYIGNPYSGGCRPECTINSECPSQLACLSLHCRDPCEGLCGNNAECSVFNHVPVCTCARGFIGDPQTACRKPPVLEVQKPCEPSPCGHNSVCRTRNNQAICSCQVGFFGQPPSCRPECLVSSECSADRACINQKCQDPCPGICGVNARCQVSNHNPICSCPPNFVGDPFVLCREEEKRIEPPKTPCIPSPCGANAECQPVNNRAVCSCLPGMFGAPPNCRPECSIDQDCPLTLSCTNQKCRDPCVGSCGFNAECSVVNHRPICSCQPGYEGDPFTGCSLIIVTERPRTPCVPSPCGPNAECREKNGAGACYCAPGFEGNPYDSNRGCRRECEVNNDCSPALACISFKCVDPCPGTCGTLAECHVNNHIPTCICPTGYVGDPFFQCKLAPTEPPPIINPCQPSPCGPNSQCREVSQQAVCSCLPQYIGSPPNCRPECVVNSECQLDKACINQRCGDPCPNTCGLGAQCTTRNHNPICACPPGYTGDPFTRCSPQPPPPPEPQTERPPSCQPSPCGPNSICKIVGSSPTCSCLPDYIGAPPNCRPECVLSSECRSSLACINQKCKDPCPGSCGSNAVCNVLNHIPICTCQEGFTGDAFTNCLPIPPSTKRPDLDPCDPSPCGPNAQCDNGICTCLPMHHGNPYEACRPECVLSEECTRDKACIRNKCVDPCPGTCGQNARCDVINHIPSCSCPDGYTGDPFVLCRVSEPPPPKTIPCNPSPCGPNSQCREVSDQAVCSCLPGYQGSPPGCRPECVVSAECSQGTACINQKCVDPCPGSCGSRARCEVRNHSPICSCAEGETGDPFQGCRPIPPEPVTRRPVEPCNPSPCGPNSVCRPVGESYVCNCLQEYIGNPPNCRPECVINTDCPSTQSCYNNKCIDPCPGSCGDNAECHVISHAVTCTCLSGFIGDPFVQCIIKTEEIKPCEPSPCGANAECKERNGAGACICLPDYQGNPYEGCRPECVLSSDCAPNRACIRNKCADPCPGTCGQNAECSVISHVPVCNCNLGFTGDAFRFCSPLPVEAVTEEPLPQNPCVPSPCGPNSQCREVNGQAVCSCLPEYQGSPPSCRPECVVSSECPANRACHKFKCANPCVGTCGIGAKCEVINHNPICSCPAGLTGDPFSRCYELPPKPPAPPKVVNPCVPSPCGPNSECRDIGRQPSCSCLATYIGVPPNCRPECVVNTDCPSHLACITEKCKDPCPGSCGFNAECRVQNHIPICTCSQGYTGNAFTECVVQPPPPVKDVDPCNPSPCGQNAVCNSGACSCLPLYQGDPYVGCRPECTMNTDCSPTKTCINLKCVDPCPGTCGESALCDVVNHLPICRCPPEYEGDPFVSCRLKPKIQLPPTNPCQPSPCGPNSVCKVNNGVAVCSCQPGMISSPPQCRPECILSAECPLTDACLNNKCVDPCPGTCGVNALCRVVNHNPICSCTSGHTGDPFTRCYPIPPPPPPRDVPHPCEPSPCGPNAVCQVRGESPACSCVEGYVGAPPSCRPECTINPECPSVRACINQKCRDPCPGSCGANAVCSVVNHNPICTCLPGQTGDPFRGCVPIPTSPPPPPVRKDPCYPSPCGPNARCRVQNDYSVCECLPEYHGNPYEGCRPECLANSDCPSHTACIQNKCQDPCPGTCGVNAICTVTNHLPVCTCQQGYTGDAFRYCSVVIEEPPRDPCNPSPCGLNTVCRTSGKNAICECLPGFFGNPDLGGCRPECTISSDCSRDKACVNTKCVDPCPGVCGFKATCNVINHSPICSCPSPLSGDPFTLCIETVEEKNPCNPSPCRANGQCRVVNGAANCIYPECVINPDCPRDKACYSQKCQDPCREACGLNAICQVVNHQPVCTCSPGFTGTPEVQCRYISPEQPKPKVECTQDSDCTNDKACINNRCQNPCSTASCGSNAECRAQLHRAICICRDGFTGNAQHACVEIGCRSDSDCAPIHACVNRECVDPCSYTSCGANALCKADGNHKTRCYCPESFHGNPLIRCERPECTKDEECSFNLACRNERCRDPCDCGLNAICNVISHRARCSCPPGYIGNPVEMCRVEERKPQPQCKMDADCPSKLACFSGVCKNPCAETKPCGKNAECLVVDSLPLRTMSCMCLPGYIGDADVDCKLAPQEESGCKSNSDCAQNESCINRQCVNPCVVSNPCSPTAECEAINHKALCKCPAPLIGDPFTRCYEEESRHPKPECVHDSECSHDKSCINERCENPCALSDPCGSNADCETRVHRPICVCPLRWVGNPQVLCYKPECKADSDCPYNKACISENCVNPCATISCGRGAECSAQNHRAQCLCPPGTQGDPLLACITGQCQYNEDCADHEACDRLNRVCRPVCDDETCAATAQCIGQNHQPKCECPIGTSGNPFTECKFPTVKPICTVDSDCPAQLGCINELCLNPCHQGNMCSVEQECRVIDTSPMRTVICACPPDQVRDSSGHCRTIVRERPECSVDNDCANPQKCYGGNCVDACRLDVCGVNAICRASNHLSQCSCPPGYTGNPRLECSLIVHDIVPRVECSSDDDCPQDKACRNQQCGNPCRSDKPCGSNAFCSVNRHQPVCRCPEGYKGKPEIECLVPPTPGIDCTTNSDCPLSEFCLNKLCISPCNCGPNADCRVDSHYATCFCKAGYSGNPQTGCFKLGCQSDSECADELQCFNQQCVNPCILGDPCAREAECFGRNHKANCRCPSDLTGDPFVRCERLECYSHQDCPNDKSCADNRCVNPCSPIAHPPCAQNAECFPQNHAAVCACPEHLPEGNPLAYCLPMPVEQPVCVYDSDCPSKLACIREQCVNPCESISPCHPSATCSVIDTTPVRTMACTCREGWVPNDNGECHAIVIPMPPGCSKDDDCPSNEACINRVCRNPCDCGVNAICDIRNHKPICSCKDGFEGNPNIFCRTIGCRIDSECDSGTACINGQCVNPCLVKNPCAPNAECFVNQNAPECKCQSGYRGNPYERCLIVRCVSNSECPDDRQCINAQCINPCLYDNPCSPRAECLVQNHIALCKCAPGLLGNPYVDCKPEPQPECREDGDCPALLACISSKCQNPCAIIEPCHNPARCQVVNSLPVRIMNCVCPPGYISSGSGTCKPVTAIKTAACTSDSACPSDKACFNGICTNPCNCGPDADCRIKDHKPICACKPGFEGNPEISCRAIGCRSNDECSPQHTCVNRQCVPVCLPDGKPCSENATCYGNHHRAICECLPGRVGNPRVACVLVGCRSDSECPSTTACINNECKNPCVEALPCDAPAECKTFNHITECICPPGTVSDGKMGCTTLDVGCTYDRDCQTGLACIGNECVNPCQTTEPCGINTVCKVVDTEPVRTMLCECLPGYRGNAAVRCDLVVVAECRTDKGYILQSNGECVCPPDTALNSNDDCVLCPIEKGLVVDERGRCVCGLEKGLIIDERGNCVCPVEFGYRLDSRGNCVPVKQPECETNDDCPDHKYCNLNTQTCDNPCSIKHCGVHAFCNATNHRGICQCTAGYTGNPETYCNPTKPYRTDFPKPEMVVSCLSDGIQVEIDVVHEQEDFNGLLYVKGHSKDEQCRRVLTLPSNIPSRTEVFKVQFGNCGLIHVNGKASFVLVIQKHPKLVTYKAQAYHIQCVYQTGEQNVTLGFNVSMLTTAGTIANTGPPPTCIMKIVTPTGQEINSAEIGDSLILQVDVQPGSIYGGFARSCVAKTMEDSVENEYLVTDENGCATDPSIFGDWSYNPDTQSLLATFHAFKFPSSDNIRFQCNIRVCFGRCQPVNCRGSDAFGRRKRAVSQETDVADPDNLLSGQLREEITIQSNAILTLERRDEHSDASLSPDAQRGSEDICVSMIGFIIALVITALLALVAVAVAVSCWLMAYRRRPKSTGPLPHPPEFPNPLFTTPEPMAEPSPDYLT